MKIELHEIPIREVVAGYADSAESGVVGYGGKLNIRPAFQREFIYKDKQRNEVIRTVQKDFPLNVMYWNRIQDDAYEILDGQQRTISICQYVRNEFSLDCRYFENLTKDEQEQILGYPLMVYICEGTDSEKLAWFKIINIAGEKLAPQELRNAVYTGKWLTEAKKFFSKTGCAASKTAGKYLNGSAIRQDYLETALKWISERNEEAIESYMAKHQKDTNCNALWLYFRAVIDWVEVTFPNYRGKLMKGQDWGIYYNHHKEVEYDPMYLEKRIAELLEDEEVTNPKGIYPYLLDGKEKYLSLRAFPSKIAHAAYTKQNGICKKCKGHFSFDEMQADHITPWSKGGRTVESNCQMLCAECNRKKSDT